MAPDPQIQQNLARLEAQQQNSNMHAAAATAQRNMAQISMFEQGNQDIVRWQLDISQELERIEHLLRGNKLVRDKEGNEMWVAPTKIIDVNGVLTSVPDNSLKPLNENGVQICMGVVIMYINKNTILSNYKDTMIDEKMLNLSDELVDIISERYMEMGMDTPEKINMYRLLVRMIVDSIHSTYLRALNGEERRSIRQIMHISQIDNNTGQQQKLSAPKTGGFWSSLSQKY